MAQKGIAFVATGSELVCGSVINTSSPWMADQLFECGYETIEHRVVSDSQVVIVNAVRELIAQYNVVIISGGLGPTSDDRTRFALAEALGCELELFPEVWQAIEARFEVLNLPVPENNRSQAMLPPDSTILPNKRGTAAGCYVAVGECHVFMLPGPPNECRPMFQASALPIIKTLMQPQWPARKHWFLLGTSEGSIASVCDPLIELFNAPSTSYDLIGGSSKSHDNPGLPGQARGRREGGVEIGYRVEYPYLELKLFATDQPSLDAVANKIESLIEQWCVGSAKASAQLREKLANCQQRFALQDEATGQRLLSRLLFPDTQQVFDDHAETVIKVTGMNNFWSGKEEVKHRLQFEIIQSGKKAVQLSRDIPRRGLRSLELACEWVCWKWLEYLS